MLTDLSKYLLLKNKLFFIITQYLYNYQIKTPPIFKMAEVFYQLNEKAHTENFHVCYKGKK